MIRRTVDTTVCVHYNSNNRIEFIVCLASLNSYKSNNNLNTIEFESASFCRKLKKKQSNGFFIVF